MASSLNSAKYLKYLSKYGESEIIIGLNSLSTDEQKALLDISGKLYKSVSQIESVAFESKSKVKKLKTISKKDLCKEVMMKIEGRLSDYEGSNKVDKWIIDFEVGLNYDSLSLEQIIQKHCKFLQSCLHVGEIQLLMYSERGRLYNNLKYSDQWSRQ